MNLNYFDSSNNESEFKNKVKYDTQPTNHDLFKKGFQKVTKIDNYVLSKVMYLQIGYVFAPEKCPSFFPTSFFTTFL